MIERVVAEFNTTKANVAIGFVGLDIDFPKEGDWRPSVGLCSQHDKVGPKRLLINRFELFCGGAKRNEGEALASAIKKVSPKTEVRITELEDSRPWDFQQVYQTLLDWVADYPFNITKENYLVHMSTGTHVAQISFFMLVRSKRLPGVLIQTFKTEGPGKSTATGFSIIDLADASFDSLLSRRSQLSSKPEEILKREIDTKNQIFNEIIKDVARVAALPNEPILLIGDTGVGKTDLARLIYQVKKNRGLTQTNFVSINCATLVGENAMAELFGTVAGRFTNVHQTKGRLASAHGGVLFLDEIGELGLKEQAMFLEAFETKEFYPLGSDKKTASDFQLIAGTNVNLAKAVQEGKFRSDLYARLNLWEFRIPNLRERPEDIEPNLDFELRRMEEEIVFDFEARQYFLSFAQSPEAVWSSNFRDFNGAIRRMAMLSEGGNVTIEDVKNEIIRLKRRWREQQKDASKGFSALPAEVPQPLDLWDHHQLSFAIEVLRGERTLAGAGRKLFAVSREKKPHSNDSDRLRKYLHKFNIKWETLLVQEHDK